MAKRASVSASPPNKRQTTGQRINKHGIFYKKKFLVYPERSQLLRGGNVLEAMNRLGAQHCTKLKPGVTHLIVFNTNSLETILRRLGIDELPEGVYAVKSDWWSESFDNKMHQPEENYPVASSRAAAADAEEDEDDDAPTEFHAGPRNPTRKDLEKARALIERTTDRLKNASEFWHALEKFETHPNVFLIIVMKLFGEYYENDHFRARNYSPTVNKLIDADQYRISSKAEAVSVKITAGMAEKVEVLARTNSHPDLNMILDDNQFGIHNLFTGIWGVGNATASKFVKLGYKTLDDVRKREYANLNPTQKIGLEHYTDFNTKIPRQSVELHRKVVIEELREIDPAAVGECMGSYRRGKDECGDIDIMITKPGVDDISHMVEIKNRLVDALIKRGFIKCTLIGDSKQDGRHSSRWFGATACKEDGNIWRRLDLFVWRWSRRGAAQLHCTGNLFMNITMSMKAIKSTPRLKLTETGLFEDTRSEHQRRMHRYENGAKHDVENERLIAAETEEEIFEALGMEFIPPMERNFKEVLIRY